MGMNEGQTVSWSGPPLAGHEPGDQGVLLSFAGRRDVAHVMWSTGSLAGATDLVEVEDLAPAHAARGLLDDSLGEGHLNTFAVRDVYEAQGEAGVINAMASSGHLTAFGEIASDVVAMVMARVRQDPSFRAVTASLDDEAGDSLVRLASVCLIRDAFGDEA